MLIVSLKFIRPVDRDSADAVRARGLSRCVEPFVRRRADDAQRTCRQQRFHHRGEIHRAAGDRAGSDSRVHLVDEENRFPGGPSAMMTALKRSLEIPIKACRRAPESEKHPGTRQRPACRH